METSKVFFTDFRCKVGTSQQVKLKRLMKAAGFESIDFAGKFVAIKIHFGELGNMSYLRSNYAKTVADYVKERGGMPFLTDCNTLYVGSRKHALEHIETAYTNGYSPFQTGCHVLIADGLRGGDEALVPVRNGEFVKEAKIGSALMAADIVISLTHFKGHEAVGFGGALKNLGMGGGSRAGKMDMHSEGKPYVNPDKCIGCRACEKICAHNGPVFEGGTCVDIDRSKCVGCGRCLPLCPKDAIHSQDDISADILGCKIAEYAQAVVDGRPQFHISIAKDISPCCDCHSDNDAPIVADIGMFASFDPVAIDVACADAINGAPALPNSWITDRHAEHEHDHFHAMHPTTNWRSTVDHAAKIGVGSTQYELVKI